MEPNKRSQQILKGASRYFTGKPCIRGHIAERFTVSGSCVKCQSIRQGSVRKSRLAYERWLAGMGIKDRFLKAHDDDWPIIEALAADMAAERERVYLATVAIPAAQARAGTIAEQRVAASPAATHTAGRMADMEARELAANKAARAIDANVQ